jgi:GT2 family glycosyltransferase
MGAGHSVETRYSNAFDVLFKNVLGYSMVMRKSAWLKAGKYDETMVDGYEDWEFNLRLIHAGYAGIEIPKPLFLYNVSMTGMMMSHSSSRHAALWRKIRTKHRNLYRLSNLIRLFRESRRGLAEASLLRTFGAMVLTNILPDAWFSAIIHFMRSRRLSPANNIDAPKPGSAIHADSRAVG